MMASFPALPLSTSLSLSPGPVLISCLVSPLPSLPGGQGSAKFLCVFAEMFFQINEIVLWPKKVGYCLDGDIFRGTEQI